MHTTAIFNSGPNDRFVNVIGTSHIKTDIYDKKVDPGKY